MIENQTCNWKIGRPMKIEKKTKTILNLNINWPFLSWKEGTENLLQAIFINNLNEKLSNN